MSPYCRTGGEKRLLRPAEEPGQGVDVLGTIEPRALDAHAVGGARGDEGGGPSAARAEDERCARVAQRRHRLTDVVDPEADVVQPLAVLVEPGCKLRVAVQRLDELDVRVAGVQIGEADVGRRELLSGGDLETEAAGVELERGGSVPDEDGDVVETPQQRHA